MGDGDFLSFNGRLDGGKVYPVHVRVYTHGIYWGTQGFLGMK